MRPLIAWLFYGLGHGWYLIFDRMLMVMNGPLYAVYNWLMLTSHRVQGPGSRGPWDQIEGRPAEL